MVADALELVEFQAGQKVFRQGEAGDRFYVIREGTGGVVEERVRLGGWELRVGFHSSFEGASCLGAGGPSLTHPGPASLLRSLPPPSPAVVLTQDGVETERLGEGAFFGEKALINDEPRATSALGACVRSARLPPTARRGRRVVLPGLPAAPLVAAPLPSQPPWPSPRSPPLPRPLAQPTRTWPATRSAARPSTSCWAPLRACGATTRCARCAACSDAQSGLGLGEMAEQSRAGRGGASQ